MDKPRRGVYVWVSWLTGLLAGTDACWWKSFHKAHFQFEKRAKESDFDLDAWNARHAVMVNKRAARLVGEKYHVLIEEQNKFTLKGKAATLGGQPDIVATRDREAVVIDSKGGQPRDSDEWQVRVYMFALPFVGLAFKAITGEVDYGTASKTLKPNTSEEVARIISAIEIIGGELEPPRVPSANECRWCDVAACPDRIVVETKTADVTAF